MKKITAPRFILAPEGRQFARLMAATARGGTPARAPARPGGKAPAAPVRPHLPAAPPKGLKVLARAPLAGAWLVQGSKSALEKAVHPSGGRGKAAADAPPLHLYAERWYHVARAGRPVLRQRLARAPGRRGAATEVREVILRVRLDAGAGRAGAPLADVLVTALVDAKEGLGDSGRTDAQGEVKLLLRATDRQIEELHLDPLHGAWPRRWLAVEVAGPELDRVLTPLALDEPDARGLAYGQREALVEPAVKVAVVDTGVGPHADLPVAGGRNTTGKGAVSRWQDWDGHGTHVAGVIAAAAQGWRRGEATPVALHAFRVFDDGAGFASNFAIGEAILQAVRAGCDLINLSLGSAESDPFIRRAVEAAWAAGSVCLAAAGNDGLARVDYPARYQQALAVSAIGLDGSWPAEAKQALWRTEHRGRKVGGKVCFLAAFSNRGDKIELAAPGVGIVSTIFGDRWGVMDGTSMATPIATGVLARRLAGAKKILDMPRDAARAEAIAELARRHARDIGLPAAMQGKGLAG